MAEIDWVKKIIAWLHDPLDKPLKIEGHANRAKEIAERLLGSDFEEINKNYDRFVAKIQRVKKEKLDRLTKRIKKALNFNFIFFHTISGNRNEFLREISKYGKMHGEANILPFFDDKFVDMEQIRSSLVNIEDDKKTFFLLWRFLPEIFPFARIYPPETRMPDHNMINHVDMVSAISTVEDIKDVGILIFKLPNVQQFISNSRKLLDLKSASYIYSWLTFKAIKYIVDKYGPDCIVYPYLRDNPLLDYEKFQGKLGPFSFETLYEKVNKIKNESKKMFLNRIEKLVQDDKLLYEKLFGQNLGGKEFYKKLAISTIPNVFVAIINYNDYPELEKKLKEIVKEEWKRISNKIFQKLKSKCKDDNCIDEEIWNSQIDEFPEPIIESVKWISPNSKIIEKLPKVLKDKVEKYNKILEEQYWINYRLLEIKVKTKSQQWKSKQTTKNTYKYDRCTMCGERDGIVQNVMNLPESLLKKDEALCAICTVKRFFRDYFIREEIEKNGFQEEWKISSVITIASKSFLNEWEKLIKEDNIESEYKVLWYIIKEEPEKIFDEEKERQLEALEKKVKKRRVKYYAIVMMDGDEIGKVLGGDKLGSLKDYYLREDVRNLLEEDILNLKRPLTSSHHAAISEAMQNFALNIVPRIVKRNNDSYIDNMLIYAGGDDILAIVELKDLFNVIREIRENFKKDFSEEQKILPGSTLTISAGIVVAHYKYPLYDAIRRCRDALKKAKEFYGRDAVCIKFIKRSGEVLEAGFKWDELKELYEFIEEVHKSKIPRAFYYNLIEVLSKIEEWDLVESSLKFILKRKSVKDEIANNLIEKIRNVITKLKEKENYTLNNLAIGIKILKDIREEGEINVS